MSMEERGIYITLLSHCWLEGWLPNGSTKLQRICNYPSNWKKSWSNIKHCFYENGGKLYHKRLEEERKKQLEWKKKSRLGGIKSGESRRQLKGGSRVVEPKGNSSSSSSSSSSSAKEKPIIPKGRKNNIEKFKDKIIAIQKAWNSFAVKEGFVEVLKINESRKNKLRLRIKEELFDINKILIAAKKQPFLMGENEREWAITFDFIIANDSNFIKILELYYLRKEKKSWAERFEMKKNKENTGDK